MKAFKSNSKEIFIREKTKFIAGITDPAQLEGWLHLNQDISGFSFVGRSNVGKSSLINSLFGKKTARISKTPGRTQQINIFKIETNPEYFESDNLYIFDLPGYGHANVSKQMKKNWQVLIDTFFQFGTDRLCTINIQDIRNPLQKADMDFIAYLKEFNAYAYLAINKQDKLKNQKQRHQAKKQIEEKLLPINVFKQVYTISALENRGIEPLKDGMLNYLLGKV